MPQVPVLSQYLRNWTRLSQFPGLSNFIWGNESQGLTPPTTVHGRGSSTRKECLFCGRSKQKATDMKNIYKFEVSNAHDNFTITA